MKLHSRAWLAMAVLGVAFGGLSTARAADKTATGDWKWEFKRQNGEALEITMNLKQEGEKLTGTIKRGDFSTEIKDGKIKDGDLSFETVIERDGNSFTIKYKGKQTGDTIKGKIEFERDGQTQSRDWEAKRS